MQADDVQDDYNFDPVILSAMDLPTHVDWTETVLNKDPSTMIPMRNQGGCGACWAFTSAAALEFYNWQAGGSFVELSP